MDTGDEQGFELEWAQAVPAAFSTDHHGDQRSPFCESRRNGTMTLTTHSGPSVVSRSSTSAVVTAIDAAAIRVP